MSSITPTSLPETLLLPSPVEGTSAASETETITLSSALLEIVKREYAPIFNAFASVVPLPKGFKPGTPDKIDLEETTNLTDNDAPGKATGTPDSLTNIRSWTEK